MLARSGAVFFTSLAAFVAVCGCGEKSVDVEPASVPASGAAPWPAPSNPLELTRKAGLGPQPREFFQYHVHAHLDVFLNGQAVPVPAGIGINVHDPAVHHGRDKYGKWYGGISLCRKPCISPLHTHDFTGVLHTESAASTPNHLGQLFTEWGVRLDRKCVGGYCQPAASILVYVDGERYRDDPGAIPLTDREEIAIVIGTPPDEIPAKFP
jgi:hypothetical protein